MTSESYRHELKYIISQGQYVQLKQRLGHLLPLDSHAHPEGFYNIRSLYFDDYANRCLNENLAGTDPREKFRIRIYNHDSKRISLECKRKERGKTLKTSAEISRDMCQAIMDGAIPPFSPNQPDILNKFILQMRTEGLHPVVIVDYDRIPYVYKAGNVRITLDLNVSSSGDLQDFFHPILRKRPVMPRGQELLEVKFDEYLPDMIHRSLNLENLSQTAFSKYFLCRKYHL